MPVVFVIDPALPKDVNTMTLSYTFFEVEGVKRAPARHPKKDDRGVGAGAKNSARCGRQRRCSGRFGIRRAQDHESDMAHLTPVQISRSRDDRRRAVCDGFDNAGSLHHK